MDEHFFEKVFTPFFIQSAAINVKVMKNLELSNKQKRFCKAIKHILPIFNKLNDDENLTISNVVNDNQGPNNNSDSDNSNNISSDSESSEEEPDEEGDKLVDAVTDTSIKKYKKIKNKKWVIANYKDLQDDENDSDEVSIESADEDKDDVQNDRQQNANETNVVEAIDQSDDDKNNQDGGCELIDIELYPCDGTTDESSDEGSEEAGYDNLCTHSSDDLYDQYENRYQDDFQASHFNAYHDYYPGGACSYMA